MLKMPLIFCDHMVLQRQKNITLWGEADPGAVVTVTLLKDRPLAAAQATADSKGSWKLHLPPMEADRGLHLQIESGENRLVLADVSVGEVWIAGGQSNMEYLLQFDADKESALALPEQPDIRFFDCPKASFEEALTDCDLSEYGFWRRCRREELPWFSAVGYYFAQKVQSALDIPVGIVGCNWGGSKACSWMAEEYLTGTPGQVWLEEYRNALQGVDLDALRRDYRGNPGNIPSHPREDPFGILFPGLNREQQLQAKEQMAGQPALVIGPDHPWRPCGLYHTMLKKIAPFTARGVLWYQGESDDVHGEIYDTVLSSMIRAWRDLWQDTLPFLIVQLAPFGQWLDCTGEKYPVVRQRQQDLCDSDPNAFLCSTADCGMEWDIHPKHKRPVGQRLALLALGHVYGQDILCDAPRLRQAIREGKEAILEFDHGQGLHRTGDPGSIPALTVNGESCSGRIEGDRLILSLPDAEEWVIAYASGAYYEADLYNAAKIPALPFTVTLH